MGDAMACWAKCKAGEHPKQAGDTYTYCSDPRACRRAVAGNAPEPRPAGAVREALIEAMVAAYNAEFNETNRAFKRPMRAALNAAFASGLVVDAAIAEHVSGECMAAEQERDAALAARRKAWEGGRNAARQVVIAWLDAFEHVNPEHVSAGDYARGAVHDLNDAIAAITYPEDGQ